MFGITPMPISIPISRSANYLRDFMCLFKPARHREVETDLDRAPYDAAVAGWSDAGRFAPISAIVSSRHGFQRDVDGYNHKLEGVPPWPLRF